MPWLGLAKGIFFFSITFANSHLVICAPSSPWLLSSPRWVACSCLLQLTLLWGQSCDVFYQLLSFWVKGACVPPARNVHQLQVGERGLFPTSYTEAKTTRAVHPLGLYMALAAQVSDLGVKRQLQLSCRCSRGAVVGISFPLDLT